MSEQQLAEQQGSKPTGTATPVIDTLNGQALTGNDTVDWNFTVEGHVAGAEHKGSEYVICRLSYPPGTLNYKESGQGAVDADTTDWDCSFSMVPSPYGKDVGLTAYLYAADGTLINPSTTITIQVRDPGAQARQG